MRSTPSRTRNASIENDQSRLVIDTRSPLTGAAIAMAHAAGDGAAASRR
jgi:hypothetical protein